MEIITLSTRNIFNFLVIGLLGLYVFYKNPRNPTNRGFFLFAIFSATWSFTDLNMINSPNYQTAYFWSFGYTLIPMIGVALVWTVVSYTENEKARKNLYHRIVFEYLGGLFTCLLIAANILGTEVIYDTNRWDVTAGSSVIERALHTSIGIWGAVILIYLIYLVYVFYRNSTDQLKKKQINYIALGSIFAISTNIIDAFAWYNNENSVWLTALGLPVFAASIAYAIIRQQMFQINPITAATTLFESVSDALILVDADYKIVAINEVGSRLLCSNEQNLLRTPIEETITGFKDKKLSIETIKQRLENNQLVQDIPVKVACKKGQIISQSLSVTHIASDNETNRGSIWSLRDISEREKVDNAKNTFFSLVSHELRVPITSIKWNAELLTNENSENLNSDQKKWLRAIDGSIDQMNNLINTFLNISRIEMGRFSVTPEPLDLKAITSRILNALNNIHLEKNIQTVTNFDDDLSEINLDRNITEIIIQNLISNAFKYTPEHGKIEVSLRKENDTILMSCKDTGIGIPKKQQSQVFKKMFRAQNSIDKGTKGNGLGLYITYSLVKATGGEIWFESKEDTGTTFYVTIPINGMQAKKGEVMLEKPRLG